MVKKCQVKFGNFRWKRAGYADVMNAAPVQSKLAQMASSAESSCNATLPGEDGYEAKQVQGMLARGYVVKTATYAAMRNELKHNYLAHSVNGW